MQQRLKTYILSSLFFTERVLQKKSTYKIAILTITAMIVVWFYFTPYIAAYNMKKAAAANDSAALSSYINFISLKESLKASFNATLATDIVKKKGNNPFEALGLALAATLMNPIIDALVTPESLAMMMQGNKPNLEKEVINEENNNSTRSETDVTRKYESFDKFTVSFMKKGETEEPVTFVFHREGLLTWKLSALRLPNLKTKEGLANPIAQVQQITLQPQLIDLSRYLGKHPTEVLNDSIVQKKIKALVGNEYGRFFENLSVASDLELKGNFYMGSGCAPHNCGIEESAFIINKETGEVIVSILSDGKAIKSFGITSEQNLPAPLYVWYKEHGGQN